MQLDDETQPEAKPADATPTPAPADTPQAEAPAEPTEEELAAKAEADKAKGEADKPKQTPWFQKRIDDLTREKWDERRKNEDLEKRLAAIEAAGRKPADGQPPQDGPQPQPTQADFDKAVAERAEQVSRANEFNKQCNDVFAQGTKDFTDFSDALGNFRMLGGLPPALIEAAIETENAAAVLYQLGKDPEEAGRILALSPTRMAVAVAKLAAKPADQIPVSKAPSPITPIAGRGRVETDPDKMTTSEWMRQRESGKIH